MAVSLVDRGVGGQAIEIALALDVIDPNTLGALDDHIERMIVMGAVLVFEFDEIPWFATALRLPA